MQALTEGSFGARGRTLLCALCCVSLLSCPGRAKAEAPASSVFENLDDSARVHVLIELAYSGRQEDAAVLLKRYPLQGKFAANRTLFIEGLIERQRGHLREAVRKFRAALAADPSLTLVRAELAKTLEMMGEDDSAKHHLELLEQAAPDAESAAGIKAFIDRIDAKRPYSFSGYISIAPSTNINNGTSNDKIYLYGLPFDIDPHSRKTSGVGLAGGLSAAYSKHLSEDLLAVVAGGANAKVYKDSDFNQYIASESADLRYLFDWGYVGLGPVASQTFGNDSIEPGYWSVGPRIALSYAIDPQNRVNASSTVEFRNYRDNDVSNGYAVLNNVALTHAFNSGFVGFVGGGVDRVTTGANHLDYWSYSATLGAYREWPMGLTTNCALELRRSNYDGDFPLMTEPREDRRLTASVSLTKRDFDIMGYAPVVEYSYTLNKSNVGFYDYDSHTVDFRLTKDF